MFIVNVNKMISPLKLKSPPILIIIDQLQTYIISGA